MNKQQLQQLAEDRLTDAKCLLDNSRFSAAYYLAGYAVECALKACIMNLVERTGVIFQDRKFAEKCWTHDLDDLLFLANLTPILGSDMHSNNILEKNWDIVSSWDETSRYVSKSPAQAQELFNSVANMPDGVLEWIRQRW